MPDDKYRMREQEQAGLEDQEPKFDNEEDEMNAVFNQTILEEGDGGRSSMKVKLDDDEFGFTN